MTDESQSAKDYAEPILILGFNRPDRIIELIDRLRPLRPCNVFVSIDGPRAEVAGEDERVTETRAAVRTIDWPCEVQTRFLDSNLGCGRGVFSGIDWFFTHVERGIILEDDVLPVSDFFTFCSELLEYYKDNEQVFAISGCNFVPPNVPEQQASYRFSALTHVWGWATWRRAWNHYRFDMSDWRTRLPMPKRWQAMGGDVPGFAYWTAVFDWMRWGHLDTWDYQWSLAQMANGGLTATSNVNLVENVGFRPDATHTTVKPGFVREVEALELPLKHPRLERDLSSDRWVRAQVLQVSTQGAWRMVKDNLVQRLAATTHRFRRK